MTAYVNQYPFPIYLSLKADGQIEATGHKPKVKILAVIQPGEQAILDEKTLARSES